MKIIKFDISNFKGIAKTSIQLADEVPGNVGTLIGLNESGKTTILEAISYFVTEDRHTANLVGTVHQKSKLQDLIPKDKKSAFTGQISLAGTVVLEEKDIDDLADEYKKAGLKLDKAAVSRKITVRRSWEFEDSQHKSTSNTWSISFQLARKTKFVKYQGLATDSAENKALWLKGVDFLKARLPTIVYFPTFLFDFPNRIYLENGEGKTNEYYIQVIQDVLDSQGEGLQVSKHIVERIDRLRGVHDSVATFMAFLFGTDEKKQIDAVLQKASNEMSRTIFGAWNEILGRDVRGKRVQIDWLLDADRDNAAYLELSIVDGQSKFALSERSLGFRWFFSFLLFTQFRKNRKDDVAPIFLFDEPAANLHSRAQIKLLESFAKIARGSAHILYSTHSHYMINPLWLENAYIVQNAAVDYDSDSEIDSFNVRSTDIQAIKYRTFVGNHPNKLTYFQPVLDALEVTFSPLVRSSKVLIVEGKNDYFPLKYFMNKSGLCRDVEVFPANGAGSVGALIALFRGWGVDFRILLDDDDAGRRGKKAYINDYFLSDKEVLTLGDISKEFSGKAFEAAYKDDLESIVKTEFSIKVATKRHYSFYFQALVAKSEVIDLPKTERSLEPLLKWIDDEFSK